MNEPKIAMIVKGCKINMTEQTPLETKEQEQTPLSKCRKEKACFEALRKKLSDKSLELSEGVKLKPNEWLMYYRLDNALRYLPDPQPFHIAEQEAEAIIGIRATHGYSIADLSFIFVRSKASIFETLKKHGVEAECPPT
jgi:hypothetical protein